MKALKLLVFIILLFILGFNKVKAQDSNLEVYNPNLPKTLAYVIKVETGNSYLPEKLLELFDVFDIEQHKKSNTYFLGQYSSKSKAELFKHSVEISGTYPTEIVAYFRQKKISMEDAITLASNQNEFESDFVSMDYISVEDLNKILDISLHAAKFYYTINVDVKDAMTAVDALESLGTINIRSFEDGAQYFSVGKFKEFDKIVKERNNMLNKGCNDVFISAHLDESRISIEHAKKLEEVYKNSWFTSLNE